MANVSPQREALLAAAHTADIKGLAVQEYDPRGTALQFRDAEGGLKPLYLRRTVSCPAISGDSVTECVAVVDERGPGITKGPTDLERGLEHTEDVIHSTCNRVILLTDSTFEVLVPQPDSGETNIYTTSGVSTPLPTGVI